MKKILFFVAVLGAMTFASCGNKTSKGADADSLKDSTHVVDSAKADSTQAAPNK